MSSAIQNKPISIDEYLKDEMNREVKHELIDGQIYAMAGASANHERISGTLYSLFGV